MNITEREIPRIKVFKVRFKYLQEAIDLFNWGTSVDIFRSAVERIDYMDQVITYDTHCIIQVKMWGNYPFIENEWEKFLNEHN